jgi:hypothetical protein
LFNEGDLKKNISEKYTYVCVYLFIIDENVDIKISAHDVFPVQASSGTFVLSKLTDFRSKKKKFCTLMKFGFPIKIICLICERQMRKKLKIYCDIS